MVLAVHLHAKGNARLPNLTNGASRAFDEGHSRSAPGIRGSGPRYPARSQVHSKSGTCRVHQDEIGDFNPPAFDDGRRSKLPKSVKFEFSTFMIVDICHNGAHLALFSKCTHYIAAICYHNDAPSNEFSQCARQT